MEGQIGGENWIRKMEQSKLASIEPIAQFVNRIGVESVFGVPTTNNDTMLIPVAQAAFGFGYGSAYGHSSTGADTLGEDASDADDISGGGGGGGRATPRGYIRVSSDGIKYEPIVDETRIPLAAMLLVAWSIFWIMATVRVLVRAVAKTKQAQRKGTQ